MTMLKMGPVARIPGTQQVITKTAHGAVRGSVADGVNAFKGISYAAPVVDDPRSNERVLWDVR